MSDPSPRLARSAGLFGLATMASRILGVVREQVIAYYFGAGDAIDAFRVAFRVPNLLRDLFAEGAMSAAFVPTFTRELTEGGKARAWRFANSVINALIVVTGVLVVAAVLFAAPLIRLYATEFVDVPGKLALTTELARVLAPFLTLVALGAAMMGMLNALGHFFVPALSPAMFNVATIAMAVILVPLAPRLGLAPIMVIAVSALVGGVGQLAVQWPALRREGYRWRPVIDLHDPGLRRVLFLMGPGMVGTAATQINVLVNTMLATGEGTGAVSWLEYAFRLMYLPIGLFGVSIAAASTPAFARLAAADDRAGLRATVASAIGLMLVLNVPATFGLMALSDPIVGLIFERGRFGPDDTAATASALRYYALGLVGYSIVRIVSPAFYALGSSRIPVAAGGISVLTNVVLNLVLVRAMGYRGLALGTSLTAVLNAGLQLWLLRREMGGIDGPKMATTLTRTLTASVLMTLVAFSTEWLLTEALGTRLVARVVSLGLAIGAALLTLALASHWLKIKEFDDARQLVMNRLGRIRR